MNPQERMDLLVKTYGVKAVRQVIADLEADEREVTLGTIERELIDRALAAVRRG
jgi:hypothetical protein